MDLSPNLYRPFYRSPLYSTSGSKNFEITCSTGVSSETFYTQDATPKVGIATTTPATTLDVNGTTPHTKILEITGADLAEKFPTSGGKVEPGTVMEIDPENSGLLRESPRHIQPAGCRRRQRRE